MFQVIAGHDTKDPTTAQAPVPDYSLATREDISGMTVGVPRKYFYERGPDMEPESLEAVEKALN